MDIKLRPIVILRLKFFHFLTFDATLPFFCHYPSPMMIFDGKTLTPSKPPIFDCRCVEIRVGHSPMTFEIHQMHSHKDAEFLKCTFGSNRDQVQPYTSHNAEQGLSKVWSFFFETFKIHIEILSIDKNRSIEVFYYCQLSVG